MASAVYAGSDLDEGAARHRSAPAVDFWRRHGVDAEIALPTRAALQGPRKIDDIGLG